MMDQDRLKFQDLYRNKVILAPMVRIGILPSRLQALRNGADLVYSEEIIDFKLLRTKKVINTYLNTIDFVDSNDTIVFRTTKEEEGKVIIQLGTSDPKRALAAAKMVEQYVTGIDINMGCPKDFSLKGGMGAALLTQPQKVKDILTTLVTNLSIPVTCKIRCLPTIEETIELVKVIETTGVSAIGIHGRNKNERPQHKNREDFIKEVCAAATVPIIGNGASGDINCYQDIHHFKERTGCDSVMVARAFESNPSIFRPQGLLPLDEVITEYLKLAIFYDNYLTNVKYTIQHMLGSLQASDKGALLTKSETVQEVCTIYGMLDIYMERQRDMEQFKTSTGINYSNREERSIKRLKTTSDNGHGDPVDITLESDSHHHKSCIKFLRHLFTNNTLPKPVLNNYINNTIRLGKVVYETRTSEDNMFSSSAIVDGHTYVNTFLEKSKRTAEQGAALVAALHFRLIAIDGVKEAIIHHHNLDINPISYAINNNNKNKEQIEPQENKLN